MTHERAPHRGVLAAGNRPLVSIITVFWNGAGLLDAFFSPLEKIHREHPGHVEVIAVDNASHDGTADEIARRFPWVELIRNGSNAGFAGGCNQGLEAARGRNLLLLNPDCEADRPALLAMARFLRRNPRAGAVGCALLHGDGLPQPSYHAEPSWWSYWGNHSLISPLLLQIRKGATRLGLTRRRRPIKVGWLMGACLMVPARVFREVGGLDPEYFMYSEDADWCRRIRDAGYDVVHLPGHSLYHHHGTSARRRPEFAFRRLYRSQLLYMTKHASPIGGLAFRLAIGLDMLLRLPIYAVSGNRERLASVRKVLAMYARNDPAWQPDPVPGREP